MFSYKKNKLNIVLIICIIINILGMFIIKDAWVIDEEEQTGWQYQISKLLYGVVILIMSSSLFYKNKYFNSLKWLVISIFFYFLLATSSSQSFNTGNYFKFIMLCLSFVFFYKELLRNSIHNKILIAYIVSLAVNVSYLTLMNNQLERVILTGYAHTGQSTAIALVYLLPLVFYKYKAKTATYFYLFALIINFISLRRTSILTLLLCIPFIYKSLKESISKKQLIIILSLIAGVIYFIIINYWFVIELRFADMFEATESGEYGSGRTGWFSLLWNNYIESPQHWIFGFGLGSVSKTMRLGGYPFGLAHNDYLELLYTFGIWGVFCWFHTFYIAYKQSNCLNKAAIKERLLVLMAIISYLFIAGVSGSIFNPNFLPIPLFLCLFLTEIKQINQEKSIFKIEKNSSAG